MARRRRRSQFRNSILFTSLFTIIGILSIFIPVVTFLMLNTLQDTAQSFALQMLSQVKKSVEFYTDEMIRVSDYLSTNDQVIGFLAADTQTLDETADETTDRIHNELLAIAGTRKDLVNILLIRNDGKFVSNREHVGLTPYWNYKTADWYQQSLEAQGKPVMSSSRVENMIAGEHRWVVSLSRAVYVKGHLAGILLIDLNFKTISDICKSLSATNQGYVFIVDHDKQMVYHPQQQLIYSGIKSERLDLIKNQTEIYSAMSEKLIYSIATIESSGWTLVSVFDTRQLTPLTPAMFISFIGVAVLFALIGLLVSLKASKTLTDPILSLKNSMQQFQKGDFDVKANLSVNNEISELGDQFNTMTDRIRSLIESSRQIEEQKRKSEIQALQSQIRPHFLYNTLESIIWMAGVGDHKKVIEMTSALAKLMRASASDGKELVSIQTEMDYVTNYLIIQKMRYQNKLQYRIEIDPEAYSAGIPRLTLQPLVENAIYHGIKLLRGEGLIIIQIQRESEKLKITIADNGVGFSQEAIQQIEHPVQASSEAGSIGLPNVINRIRLFFGPDASFTVETTQEGNYLAKFSVEDKIRTAVIIKLPLFFT